MKNLLGPLASAWARRAGRARGRQLDAFVAGDAIIEALGGDISGSVAAPPAPPAAPAPAPAPPRPGTSGGRAAARARRHRRRPPRGAPAGAPADRAAALKLAAERAAAKKAAAAEAAPPPPPPRRRRRPRGRRAAAAAAEADSNGPPPPPAPKAAAPPPPAPKRRRAARAARRRAAAAAAAAAELDEHMTEDADEEALKGVEAFEQTGLSADEHGRRSLGCPWARRTRRPEGAEDRHRQYMQAKLDKRTEDGASGCGTRGEVRAPLDGARAVQQASFLKHESQRIA